MIRAVSKTIVSSLLLITLFCPLAIADLLVDKHINSLVEMATNGKKDQFIQMVKDQDLLEKVDVDGHSPIFAALFGPPEISLGLLDLGAAIEQQDNLGYTPLISAALLGYPEAVTDLLNRGAKIEAKNHDGQTALMISVLGYATNQVDVNAVSDNHWHSHWAKVIDILLKHGADVNATDYKGVSPLFMAIFSQNYELCKKLIDAGANPNHKLPSGVSMLRFAKVSSSKAIIEMLVAHGAQL